MSKMNSEEENKYLAKVGKEEIKLDGIEFKINEKLKNAGAEVARWRAMLQRLEKQKEGYEAMLNAATGKMDTLSQLLVDEENERRMSVIEDNNKEKEIK